MEINLLYLTVKEYHCHKQANILKTEWKGQKEKAESHRGQCSPTIAEVAEISCVEKEMCSKKVSKASLAWSEW